MHTPAHMCLDRGPDCGHTTIHTRGLSPGPRGRLHLCMWPGVTPVCGDSVCRCWEWGTLPKCSLPFPLTVQDRPWLCARAGPRTG